MIPSLIYIRATFSPKHTDDLRPECAHLIGKRCVWESTHVIEEGRYAGMLEWDQCGGPWVPDCDLVDREPATRQDFNAEAPALLAAGVN